MNAVQTCLQMTLLYQLRTRNIDKVDSTLSNELQQVNKWCENNHVAINISKTKLNMYVTSNPTHRQLSNTHSLPSVHLLDSVVDESSS